MIELLLVLAVVALAAAVLKLGLHLVRSRQRSHLKQATELNTELASLLWALERELQARDREIARLREQLRSGRTPDDPPRSRWWRRP